MTWAVELSTSRWWLWEKRSAPSSHRTASPIWAATISTRFWPCWPWQKPESPSKTEESLTGAEWYLLFDECREKKESLNPNSRKITVDLERVRKDWREVSIGVDAFYERCRPLVEASRKVVEALLAAHPDHAIDTLYLTGGGSELPSVARVLRETFGRRVQRSAYMRSATAIGLAIRAEGHEDRPLRDQFTKNFGVGVKRMTAAMSFSMLSSRGE